MMNISTLMFAFLKNHVLSIVVLIFTLVLRFDRNLVVNNFILLRIFHCLEYIKVFFFVIHVVHWGIVFVIDHLFMVNVMKGSILWIVV